MDGNAGNAKTKRPTEIYATQCFMHYLGVLRGDELHEGECGWRVCLIISTNLRRSEGKDAQHISAYNRLRADKCIAKSDFLPNIAFVPKLPRRLGHGRRLQRKPNST